MKLFRGVVLLVLAIASASAAAGSDLYAFRFDTRGNPATDSSTCTELWYRDEMLFLNSGDGPATIELLGISNGSMPESPLQVTIERGAVASSVWSEQAPNWYPPQFPSMWVVHLNVPADIDTVSRLWVPTRPEERCVTHPFQLGNTYTGIRMPTFRQLTPAGVPQIHLGTDIGSNENGIPLNSRTNVGLYNGASVAANATIELVRNCDGRVIDSRSAVVPPNTALQISGLMFVDQGDCAATNGTRTIVTVDQPSLSYAITLSSESAPFAPVTVAP